jgi:hypothetical protein
MLGTLFKSHLTHGLEVVHLVDCPLWRSSLVPITDSFLKAVDPGPVLLDPENIGLGFFLAEFIAHWAPDYGQIVFPIEVTQDMHGNVPAEELSFDPAKLLMHPLRSFHALIHDARFRYLVTSYREGKIDSVLMYIKNINDYIHDHSCSPTLELFPLSL